MLLYMLSHHSYGIKMHHSEGVSTTIRHNFAYTLTLMRLNGLQRLPKLLSCITVTSQMTERNKHKALSRNPIFSSLVSFQICKTVPAVKQRPELFDQALPFI